MQIIKHRVNSIEALKSLNPAYGAEIDLRSRGNEIYLNHDPFTKGDSFEEWLDSYNHGTLILNTKEEGLEQRIISLLKERNIKDYFFLDLSFPFLIKTSLNGEKNIAVRLSEYESIETVNNVSNMVDWVWLDSFFKFIYDIDKLKYLRNLGVKICIVSPELQDRWDETEINEIKIKVLDSFGKDFHVCTKFPEKWL